MKNEKVMGMIVESINKDRVRIKFLGLPGEEGTELRIERSLAEQLSFMLFQHLKTGERMETKI
jgi:hypothetical protein